MGELFKYVNRKDRYKSRCIEHKHPLEPMSRVFTFFTVSAVWFKMLLWKIQFNYFSPTNHDFLVLVRTLHVLFLA